MPEIFLLGAEGIRAAALQYVRQMCGCQKPAKANLQILVKSRSHVVDRAKMIFLLSALRVFAVNIM